MWGIWFYESWLAKRLLWSGYPTIMLFGMVFTEYREAQVSGRMRRHEGIHCRQWRELTVVSLLVLAWLVLLCGISVWWLLCAPVVYYVWYALEWAVKRLFVYGNGKPAYRNVSFEREAYGNECDADYVGWFGWVKRIV